MTSVLRHLCRAALLSGGDGLADAQLLEAFLARRDEGAFEALVRRHGPMVLGVCRRVLRQEQDAEDAFQATFLVLARKAGSLRSREVLAAFLYAVAYRTARKALAMNARRRVKEREAQAMPRSEAPADEELLGHLDREVSRLPDKYRAAVILCDLEGKTRREAARQLKVPEGTVSSRLAQARKLLAKRLARYGPALPATALAALLSEATASACVPKALVAGVGKAAVRVAAGNCLAAGAVSPRVVALTEGVMKAMLLSKLNVVWAVVVALAVGAGVVGFAYRALAQPGPEKPGRVPAPREVAGPNAGPASAPDDLDAIRLEIEALRKEVRALRERVKSLESQGRGQKRADEARQLFQRARARFEEDARRRLTVPDDPVAEAGEAVKKLQRNPDDKQAAEALERALQRLKERKKPVDRLPNRQ